MSTMYFAFKHGQLLREHVFAGWKRALVPHALSAPTLVHVKMMFRVPCAGVACTWCTTSERAVRGTGAPHWVCYYASLYENWHYEVDLRRFNDEPGQWTYMAVPLRGDAEAARVLVHSQCGKSFNRTGFFCNFLLGASFGVTTLDPHLDLSERSAWLCDELALVVLAKFGCHDALKHLVPCRTMPMQFWSELRRVPGAKILLDNPAALGPNPLISQGACLDAHTLHWPPRGRDASQP